MHAAHGYLLHSSSRRCPTSATDAYGGSFDNRVRFPLEVIGGGARGVARRRCRCCVRISATDWAEGGWTAEETVELARRMKALGVDLVDCSTGGWCRSAHPHRPGLPGALRARGAQEAGVPTGAVGLLTEPVQVEQVLAHGDADAVFLARALLRDAYWPQRAAQVLRERSAPPLPPVQYARAWPRD